MRHAFSSRSREPQPFSFEVALDERIEAGLVDGYYTLLETFDLLGIDVDAKYVVASIGKAGARD
jgi:hypothetical protein